MAEHWQEEHETINLVAFLGDFLNLQIQQPPALDADFYSTTVSWGLSTFLKLLNLQSPKDYQLLTVMGIHLVMLFIDLGAGDRSVFAL